MQLRVVTDQPWDVRADVLVIPVVGEPAFEGPLDELDRRSGGELRALVSFRELTGKRYSTTVAAAGELPAERLLTVGAGDAARLDRETLVRIGATAERRLGGRNVRRLAIWLAPLIGTNDGGISAETTAELALPPMLGINTLWTFLITIASILIGQTVFRRLEGRFAQDQ